MPSSFRAEKTGGLGLEIVENVMKADGDGLGLAQSSCSIEELVLISPLSMKEDRMNLRAKRRISSSFNFGSWLIYIDYGRTVTISGNHQ